MNFTLSKRNLFIVSMVISVVLFDQITKYIVKKHMILGKPVPVIGDFFRLHYIENPGMAFGFQIENKILFTFLSLAAALIVLFYLYKMRNDNLFLVIALSLIMGGAIGNIIDRLFYGSVIDFLDFEFIDISIPHFDLHFFNFPGLELSRWPVFNIADSSVTIGMFIIAWMILFFKEKPKLESTI